MFRRLHYFASLSFPDIMLSTKANLLKKRKAYQNKHKERKSNHVLNAFYQPAIILPQ